jgi:hypothetical protein
METRRHGARRLFSESDGLKKIGRIFIILGVSVWIPYFALKITGEQVELMSFLPFHLALVIPGSALVHGSDIWNKILGRGERSDDTT